MSNTKLSEALIFLGFQTGWACTDTEIILWQNNEPKPTAKELDDAYKELEVAQVAAKIAKDAQRQAVLDKLGLSADEAQALFG